MSEPIFVVVILVALGALIIAIAPQISQILVRMKANRLPSALSLRMEEEWLAELQAISNRASKLSFAVALTLTRRRAFVAPGEDLGEMSDRRVSFFASRKSLVVISTIGFALTAYALSFLLPIRYASDTVFMFRPKDVPDEYVHDVENMSNAERVKSLKSVILSRTTLSQIARDIEAKMPEFKTLSMDQRVKSLKDDIEITTGSPDTGEYLVTLRYTGSDPTLVQQIARRLTNLVIQKEAQNREMRINGTVEFLTSELDKLVADMREHDKKLTEERRIHGEASDALLVLEHEILQTRYRTLSGKLADANMRLSLEVKQKGSQIIVLDEPALGVRVGPDRLSITGVGAVIGFALGGMAVFGLKRKQSRVLA
jgi:uncharacterized protein involved in exopolysaccharide biosynthesis